MCSSHRKKRIFLDVGHEPPFSGETRLLGDFRSCLPSVESVHVIHYERHRLAELAARVYFGQLSTISIPYTRHES